MANVTFETFAPPAWMAELESVISELSRSTPEERLPWGICYATLSAHRSTLSSPRSIRTSLYPLRFLACRASLSEEVRGAIRRVLDQLKLLHDSRPHFARLVQIAHNRVRLDDIIVPGACSNMFRILRVVMCEFGYKGDEDRPLLAYDPLFAFTRFESTALGSRSLLGHEREFPEFNVNGSSFLTTYP
ncbi:hypothetical protein B0H16DRAFT_1723934 [Mycena metata]|uniref:Uncharacterized protein n=1 Tax=Mycena metata TaxID=1033252 RepID=A0AAD7IX17_9AGAR|nr:hypothetical protein B0H16DRAFT_1723934 [Mycena metata]